MFIIINSARLIQQCKGYQQKGDQYDDAETQKTFQDGHTLSF